MSDSAFDAGAPALTLCPRCGVGFSVAQGCAGACGSRAGCALLCCPGCGSSFPHPRRSRLAYRLARWLGRRRNRPAAGAAARPEPLARPTLDALAVGAHSRVAALLAGPERARQLTALGLLPGTDVRVRQRHPALVLEFGETTLALDREVAREIAVEG